MKKIANQVYFTQTKNKIAVVKKYLINTINLRIETISHFKNLIRRMNII